MTRVDATAEVRRAFYLLLGAATLGIATAKIVGSENVFEPSRYKPGAGSFGADRDPELVPTRVWPTFRPEPTPMFSSNDRSRWATIRALVDDGTYVIGQRENHTAITGYRDTGIIFEPDYQSLDKVMDPATGRFYSSKPPLMPTLLAGEYWVLKQFLGWSIVHDRWNVMATILVTVNVLPFAVYLLLLAKLLEIHGTTDFGRLLGFATACLGSYLITFSGTLNNHSPAAFCIVFAIYPLLRNREVGLGGWLVSGFFAGLAMALELPAAAFLAGIFVPTLLVRPRGAVALAVGAAIPLAALIACNFAAMGTWKPAYGEFGGPWYNFPGSHWAKLGTPGIDFAHQSKLVYAFHLLLGHHGWFSLTPVWILAAVGLGKLARDGKRDVNAVLGRGTFAGPLWTLPLLAAVTVSVSVVVFAFYVWKTNNYGGSTSGPRWLFWLTPLWILGLVRCGDGLARSATGRVLAAFLLGFSAMSAFYPAWNPWRSPWILQWFEIQGWVRY